MEVVKMTIEEVKEEVNEIIYINNYRHYKEGLYNDDDYINYLEQNSNIRIDIIEY